MSSKRKDISPIKGPDLPQIRGTSLESSGVTREPTPKRGKKYQGEQKSKRVLSEIKDHLSNPEAGYWSREPVRLKPLERVKLVPVKPNTPEYLRARRANTTCAYLVRPIEDLEEATLHTGGTTDTYLRANPTAEQVISIEGSDLSFLGAPPKTTRDQLSTQVEIEGATVSDRSSDKSDLHWEIEEE